VSPEPRSVLVDLVAEPVVGVAGRFHVHVLQDWCVLYVFGGMTKAIALDVARRVLDRSDLELISAQATYVAAISHGTIAVQADVVRSGKRGAQVQVRMWRVGGPDGDPAGEVGGDLLVDVVFGPRQADAPTVIGATMPADAATPETSRTREEMTRNGWVDIPFHAQTDWRLASGSFDLDAPPGDPRTVSWFRFQRSPIDGTGAWHPAALAVPGDILGPAVGRGLGGSARYFVITLQLSLQWLAPLTTEWVCQHSTVVRGTGGFVTGVAELWSADGDLVGFATQTAVLRPFDRVAADGLGGDETQG
jgi:acyl-CoA thioesterase